MTTAASDPSGWTNGSVQVTLTASDKGGSGVATTYYRIGDGDAQTYSAPITASDATPISYWSTDTAGNEEAHNTLTPQIDTIAPVTTAATDPSGWTNGSVQVTLTASDKGGSGLDATWYKIGDGDAQAYSGPFTVSDATPITYWSTDKAGNEEAHNTLTPQIDTTAPVTTASTDPSGWTNGSVQVTLTAADTGGSGLDTTWYKVGDGDAQAYSGPFTATDATQISYWSTDKAGNEEAHNTLTPQIDTTAPVTTAATDPSGWTNGKVDVTLTATDAGGSGVDTTWYQIGDAPAVAYSGAFAVSDATQITYWSTDKAGNEEAHNTLTPQIDTTAPVTTAATDSSGWTNGKVDVTLTATDAGGSGVDTTWYQIGDAPAVAYSGAFAVSDATQITYWSTDKAGNEEAHNTLTPQIDTTAPVTTASTDPSGWTNGSVQVTLTAADTGGSGLDTTWYKIGDGDAQAYSGPFTATDATQISYWSTDKAGNEEAHNTLTPQIDTIAPVTTAASDPSGWTNGSVQVTLTASDKGGSGVATTYYRIGDGDAQTYSAPFTVSDATPISYWSTDTAGNEEGHKTLTPQIDTTPPVTTTADLAVGPDDDWQASTATDPATVTLAATDDQSGVATTTYQIDDQAPQTYDGPIVITGEGSHKVTFYSTDAVGNQEAPQSGYVNIDSLAPTSSADGLQVDGATGWQQDAQSVTLTASDDGSGMKGGQSGIFYSLDGLTYSAYTGPFTVTTEGSNQVWYYAVDAAGNLETAHSGFVNIDTTPPVTTATGLVAVSDGGYIHGSQQVTLTAVDSGSGMTGGKAATWYTDTVGDATPTPKPYTGTPFTVSGVGTHTITYYSVDALGNAETVQTGYVNILPDQALVTLASGLADNDHSGWLTTGSADVSLSTSGGGGTITTQYRVDDGPQWLAYTGPFSVAGDGSHRVDYRSSDNVGDGWSQSTGYVNIDTVGPATVVTAPTTPQRATVTVRFSGTDSLSGYSTTFSKVDGGKWSAGPTAVVTALASHKADGVHTISYYSMDVAGNAGPTGQVKVTIDTRRPSLTLRGATKVTVRKGRFLALRYRSVDAGGACKLVLTFSRKVHGKAVKTSFTISAKRVSSWQSSKLRLKLAKGAYTVKLQLCDLAGNLSAVKTMHVTVK